MNEKSQKRSGSAVAVGIGAGIAVGAGIGVATDNLALWIGICMALGAIIGAFFL